MTKLFIPSMIKHIARSKGIGYSIAVSTTGRKCFLLCRHCYGKALEFMMSIYDEHIINELVKKVRLIKRCF